MFNDQIVKKKYDLEERTAKFGENIIGFANRIPRNAVTLPMIGQLVSAGTSVGANYCEADDAESNRNLQKRSARNKTLA